jgi:hypothetical protein
MLAIGGGNAIAVPTGPNHVTTGFTRMGATEAGLQACADAQLLRCSLMICSCCIAIDVPADGAERGYMSWFAGFEVLSSTQA